MNLSFFKKDKPSPDDKGKLRTIIFLIGNIENILNTSRASDPKIKEILEIIYQTLKDLSFHTDYLSKTDLLADLHVLQTMAEKSDLTPMISYLTSVKRIVTALSAE
jgi:hypothetical protein